MVKRGDTAIFNVEAVDNTNNMINVTGANFWFTVKNAVTDLDDDIVFQKTLGNGITVTNYEKGWFRVTIAPADTSGLPTENVAMVYDLQLLDSSNNVWTLNEGVFMVTPDVTRAVV